MLKNDQNEDDGHPKKHEVGETLIAVHFACEAVYGLELRFQLRYRVGMMVIVVNNL